MPDTPTTALIAGISSVVSAAIPVAWNAITNKQSFLPLSEANSVGIAAVWVGSGTDVWVENNSELLRIQLSFSFSFKGTAKKITAEVTETLMSTEGVLSEPVRIKMSGGFLTRTIMQLTYSSLGEDRQQCGVVLLKLNDVGRYIIGNYAGYSPTRCCLICGTLSLERAA